MAIQTKGFQGHHSTAASVAKGEAGDAFFKENLPASP